MADLKEVYQASTEEITLQKLDSLEEKWEGKPWNWGQILEQLCIYFEGRINKRVWINRNDNEQAAKSS